LVWIQFVKIRRMLRRYEHGTLVVGHVLAPQSTELLERHWIPQSL